MSRTQLIDLSSLTSLSSCHQDDRPPSFQTREAIPEIAAKTDDGYLHAANKEARSQTENNNKHQRDNYPTQNKNRNGIKQRITMKIQCLTELTPLDMMDLSFGINDPTGSCIWLGAFFFLEMFARHLDLPDNLDGNNNHDFPAIGDTNELKSLKYLESAREAYVALSKPCSHLQWSSDQSKFSPIEMRQYLFYLRHYLFPPECEILELGAGTGMSGLSLVVVNQATRKSLSDERSPKNGPIRPSLLVLTDANKESLKFCHRNLETNIDPDQPIFPVHVKRLKWGPGGTIQMLIPNSLNESTNTELSSTNDELNVENSSRFKSAPSLPSSYDTIIATDVLYDLSSLQPLLTTASELLKNGGHFILSHVPRASVPKSLDEGKNSEITEKNATTNLIGDEDFEYHVVGTSQQIEPIIIREALKVNLRLASFPEFTHTDNVAPDTEGCNYNVSDNDNSNGLILRPTLLSHVWENLGMDLKNFESIHSSPSSAILATTKYNWQTMVDVGAAIIVFQKQPEQEL